MNRFLLLASLVALASPATAQCDDPLYAVSSPVSYAYSGEAVGGAGDVNADGYDDFIVGTPDNNSGSYGLAKVYSGRTGERLYSWSVRGVRFGYAVDGAGDVNGDGYDDLVVGQPGGTVANGFEGQVFVYSGLTGDTLYVKSAFGDDADFGHTVAGAGDVDRDGYDDFIAGAPRAFGRRVFSQLIVDANGAAVVFSGRTGEPIHTWIGDDDGDYIGNAVDGAGDVDADGYPDLVVGARSAQVPGDGEGEVYVYSGRTGERLHTWTSPSLLNFDFGFDVSGAGDVDADGHADVIVGSFSVGAQESGAFVYSGRTGALLHSWFGESYSSFGLSVSGAGDADRDGHDDLLVGAYGAFVDNTARGAAYLYSGQTGALLQAWYGEDYRDRVGYAVSDAGDVNADGFPDVVIGAPGVSGSAVNSGVARVYSLACLTASGVEPSLAPLTLNPAVGADGGSLLYEAALSNDSGEPQTVEAWVTATLPDEVTRRVVAGPVSVTLAPGQAVAQELRLDVPAAAPPGTYEVTLRLGTYPDVTAASASFTFEKEEAADRAAGGSRGGASAAAVLTSESLLFDEHGVAAPSLVSADVGVAAYPNPFASRTTLGFGLPAATEVRLAVYDVLGREVAVLADGRLEAGAHEVAFDGAALPAGTYLVRLVAGGAVHTQRLTLLR